MTGLRVSTRRDEIRAGLEPVIAADPVRGTVFGTQLLGLTDTAWLARNGRGVAARSGAEFPVVVLDWTDGLDELAALLTDLGDVVAVNSVPPVADVLAAALGWTRTRVHDQRLFRLDELTSPDVPGRARRADGTDADLIAGRVMAFAEEAGVPRHGMADRARAMAAAGECWLWEDAGEVVALAGRRPPVFGSARIGPVHTPPEFRGHGYGSAVTAAATADVIEDGAIPVLFTDLANPVSNSIYPKLGYYPVEDRRFIDRPG